MAKLLGGKINNKYYLKEKLESTFIQRLDAKLLKISLFYTTFKEKYNKMVKYDINKAYHRKKKDILVELIPLEWAGLKIYREKLTNAAKLCNKLDIMLVLATVPLRDGSDYYEKLKGEMRKVAKEFDLMFVDVANEFDAMDEEETKSLFLPDGVHLNKGGTAKVAEIIFRYFVNHRDGSELEVTI